MHPSHLAELATTGEPQFDQDDEPEAVLGAYAPGDATMLESEEFSMISVDSLPSRVTGHSSPSQPLHPTEQQAPADRSYMPSSPPAMLTEKRTPVLGTSTPENPNAPPPMHTHDPSVATPLRESARKSGRALQDALNGPFRESVSREQPAARESVFAGFSSGTRRQLRQSLHLGQNLASQSFNASAVQDVPRLAPTSNSFPNYLSPFQSPVRHSDNCDTQPSRLLAPESDGRSQSRSDAVTSPHLQGNVQYPQINEQHQTTSPLNEKITASYVHATSAQMQSPPRSSPASEQDVPQENLPEESVADDEEDKDIWQEEASRSLVGDEGCPEPTDLFLEDLPIKPRRSKLPGTWRRTSGANFSYSDSPEPDERQNRKASASTAGSSRKSSGVMTPPSSDDGSVEGKDGQSKQCEPVIEGSHAADSERLRATNDEFSQSDQDSNASGDDTGMFWQANLPSVYASKQQHVSDSAKSSFAPSSPLRNTVLDISPMKPDQAPRRGLNPNLSAGPSPLRRKVLDSSSLHGTKGAQNRSVQHEISETQTDSSLASDAQQLQREMRRQTSGDASTISSFASGSHQRGSKRYTSASTIDLTVSNASENDASMVSSRSRSYQEELNLESPMRVKVNFNDSEGNSTLLEPKRHYPPLFANVPTLSKPTSVSPEPAQPKSPIARLTESFWEAVTKPPLYTSPERKPAVVVEPVLPTGVPDHVLRLRRKYGLLPDTHPFIYAHIRTLHRMLNSTRSRPGSSIVPRSGPLGHGLSRLLGKTKTNELDQHFTWTQPYLHVVDSFMSLLLPQEERHRLQHETGSWGDAEAIRHRGRDSKGRYGDTIVFDGVKGGLIEASWVADVLVDIIFKEEMNARKKKVAEMLARADSFERTHA